MKSLNQFITESSKESKVQERLKLNNERLVKLESSLDKFNKQLNSMFDKYENDAKLCKLIPADIFKNFKYISYAEERSLLKEMNRKRFEYPYNIGASDLYYKLSSDIRNQYKEKYGDNYWDAYKDDSTVKLLDKFYWDYLTKGSELIKRIHDKEEAIKDINAKNEELLKSVDAIKNVNTMIEDLFDRVPELKEFLDNAAEKQLVFLEENNEAIKKAWDKYHNAYADFREKYGSSVSSKNTEALNVMREIDKMRPKKAIISKEDMIRLVNDWKHSEASIMAQRLTTEFGDIIDTHLTFGADGNVNGFIKGSLKSAKIETIFAGGYNIQCLHTRLLIHEK